MCLDRALKNAATSLLSRFTLPPEVGFRHVQDFISVAVDHGLHHIQVEPCGLGNADRRWQRDFLTSDCYVNKGGTWACKRLSESGLDLLRGVDSPSTNPGGVRDVGEILVAEGRAIGLDASGLHLL